MKTPETAQRAERSLLEELFLGKNPRNDRWYVTTGIGRSVSAVMRKRLDVLVKMGAITVSETGIGAGYVGIRPKPHVVAQLQEVADARNGDALP